MKYFSPAKVNLFFRILRKREDGYHEIASLYSAIDYGDFLDIQLADEDRFTCTDSRLKQDPTNLIMKALYLFRHRLKVDTPVEIYLEKNIPMQAGLGGGSSNAATTLWALNEQFGSPFSLDELLEMASTIGSDVSFFLSTGSAYCQGRGELLENIPIWTAEDLWIAVPDFLVSSTPEVYKLCRPNEMSHQDPRILLEEFLVGKFSPINDLQPAAFRSLPPLEFAYAKLQEAFSHVALTGSGSAFYALQKNSSPLPSGFTFVKAKVIERSQMNWYSLPLAEIV